MSNEQLISNLQNMGWKDFAPGEFKGFNFEQVGQAKVDRYNWFVLIQSLPVLDVPTLETWNQNYKELAKKARAGFVSSGKYFVLILLIDTISADLLELLSKEDKLDLLKMPDITRGGGYTLMLIKDRQKIFMPKSVSLSPLLKATEWNKQTYMALDTYKNSLKVEKKTVYAMLWTSYILPEEKVFPTLAIAFKDFAAKNAEFKALSDEVVATRAPLHASNQTLGLKTNGDHLADDMTREGWKLDHFRDLLKKFGDPVFPHLDRDVFKIEFKDESGADALAWVCFYIDPQTVYSPHTLE